MYLIIISYWRVAVAFYKIISHFINSWINTKLLFKQSLLWRSGNSDENIFSTNEPSPWQQISGSCVNRSCLYTHLDLCYRIQRCINLFTKDTVKILVFIIHTFNKVFCVAMDRWVWHKIIFNNRYIRILDIQHLLYAQSNPTKALYIRCSVRKLLAKFWILNSIYVPVLYCMYSFASHNVFSLTEQINSHKCSSFPIMSSWIRPCIERK